MYYLKVFIIFSFIFCFPPDVFAKMYKWVDEKGQTHLSDRPKPLDPSIDLSESSVSQKQLPGDIISLDFNDTDIKIILRLMASVGKISITWGSDVKGKITTKIENIPWDQAFEMILNQNSLAYQFTDYGVLVFSRSKLVDTEMNNEKRKRISSDRDNQEATGVLERDGVYVAYANGIVKDTKTGLEWLAGPDKDTHWNHAKAWVESVKIGGGGWRMPTIDELEGLHKKGLTKRNMTPLLTLKTTGDSVWSSETNVLWNFNVGFIIEFTKGTGIRNNRAFAVRSTSSMAKSKGPSVSSKQTSSKPIPSRRTHAPNDSPWPIGAGYVSGYKKRHMNGLSTVTVDNSQNNSAVFVKLFSLNGSKAYPVRIFYIPAYGLFTLNKIRPGRYDVRYRDLGTGELAKSEAFDLKQTSTYKRTQYSKIRMTLYKVSHGNMQTYKISENEF